MQQMAVMRVVLMGNGVAWHRARAQRGKRAGRAQPRQGTARPASQGVTRPSLRGTGRLGVQKRIPLLAQLVEQIKLGFEKVDMPLFIRDQFVKEPARDEIARLVTIAPRLDIK